MLKITLVAAATAAATLATVGSAFAWDRGPVGSDHNLRYSRAYVERAADMLSHDMHDYGGHRVAAMNDINAARTDLTTALQYDRNREDAVIPQVSMPGGTRTNWVRGQHGSNENIEFTRRYVEKAIDMLSHDRHDYNGYRVKAIHDLQGARAQLLAALRYR
jgi:hypothetical protein